MGTGSLGSYGLMGLWAYIGANSCVESYGSLGRKAEDLELSPVAVLGPGSTPVHSSSLCARKRASSLMEDMTKHV